MEKLTQPQNDEDRHPLRIRKSILRRVLKIGRENPHLNDSDLLIRAELETEDLFNQLDRNARPQGFSPRRLRRTKETKQRKEHVGRFFLHLMENELRKAEIPEFLFPVFASSVHNLLGDERYLPLAQKIENLLDRGRQKGLGYDEILDSSPGRRLTEEILWAYRAEMVKINGFETQLRNLLDEKLVKAYSLKMTPEDFNIEEAIARAYNEFVRLLESLPEAEPNT